MISDKNAPREDVFAKPVESQAGGEFEENEEKNKIGKKLEKADYNAGNIVDRNRFEFFLEVKSQTNIYLKC